MGTFGPLDDVYPWWASNEFPRSGIVLNSIGNAFSPPQFDAQGYVRGYNLRADDLLPFAEYQYPTRRAVGPHGRFFGMFDSPELAARYGDTQTVGHVYSTSPYETRIRVDAVDPHRYGLLRWAREQLGVQMNAPIPPSRSGAWMAEGYNPGPSAARLSVAGAVPYRPWMGSAGTVDAWSVFQGLPGTAQQTAGVLIQHGWSPEDAVEAVYQAPHRAAETQRLFAAPETQLLPQPAPEGVLARAGRFIKGMVPTTLAAMLGEMGGQAVAESVYGGDYVRALQAQDAEKHRLEREVLARWLNPSSAPGERVLLGGLHG